jgi:hypothetical protein
MRYMLKNVAAICEAESTRLRQTSTRYHCFPLVTHQVVPTEKSFSGPPCSLYPNFGRG